MIGFVSTLEKKVNVAMPTIFEDKFDSFEPFIPTFKSFYT